MYPIGSILLIKDFDFQQAGKPNKDKFLIPLGYLDDELILLVLPSSQQYVSEANKKEGCISTVENGLSMYHFPAGKTVGQNGFAFSKDTYLYFPQVLTRNERELLEYNVSGQLQKKDELTKAELVEVVYCAFKSIDTPERYKPILEQVLQDLHA